MKLSDFLDLTKNELRNPRAQNLASDPGSPVEGQFYWNTTDKTLDIFNGSVFVSLSTGGGVTDGDKGDVTVSGSGATWTVDAVGGASAANIADAVTKRHTQHTDTGTTATSFDVDSGGTGFKLKNSSGTVALRNLADNADAHLTANNGTFSGNLIVTGDLTVSGTTTTLNTTTMETGDNNIVLNSEITTAAGNTTGGVSVKRLDPDNTTRRDAVVQFNETTDRWEALHGVHTAALVTRRLSQVYSQTIGDGAATTITVNQATHGLASDGTLLVATYDATSGERVYPTETVNPSTGACSFQFAVAPTSNQYRVVIIG